jgi:hypothetical protein
MKQVWNQIGEWWCMRMHDSVMWPSHGQYRCRTCMREYAVQFEGVPQRGREQSQAPLAGWVATRRA